MEASIVAHLSHTNACDTTVNSVRWVEGTRTNGDFRAIFRRNAARRVETDIRRRGGTSDGSDAFTETFFQRAIRAHHAISIVVVGLRFGTVGDRLGAGVI